ncbi:MAG: hypothetical protein CVV42_10580 [Candidatus Riflebacteria bacterium HGW-Riflebacteria-2]|nr:MAG: hypothetical protein CVV42_10580 [Candidatus Riflebacteria bacterium HGW-Riflebacteria-2]
MKSRIAGIIVVLCFFQFATSACAGEISNLIKEMTSAYSTGGEGMQNPDFIAKVGEIDEHLREALERDHDITPFKELLKSANQLKARKAARQMFEVVLEKAYKRLQFTKAQQDTSVDEKTHEEVGKMIVHIEHYLDPSIPDLDTVDRKGLEEKRKSLQGKIRQANEDFRKLPEEKRISVEVMREDGSPGNLSLSRQDNLLDKLATVIPEPGKMKVAIKLLPDKLFDMEIFVQNFVAPNGFSVVEGELGFSEISLEALDDSNASELDNVLGDSYFRRYRIVQNEEQLNVMPQVGEAAYEMGSLAPGQTWKMPFKSTSNFSSIIKELEGNTDIAVINAKTAVSDKAIEFKNTSSRNLIFLQGTDVTGLVSVKAIGFLIPKKGQVTFREALMIVDDALSSDITSYIGGQGINWFLKRASDNLRKGLPFTPVLENINMDRDESGKMVYIFSGRGKVAR